MKYKATIFIPTFNGEKYIGNILQSITSQVFEGMFEVLVIDSGSSDDTLKIIRDYTDKYENFRLHEIPNSEFGHGKTRQLAATMARGEFVVYLSHDAVPAHDKWLYEMVKPFSISEKIVGVMGKQIPRSNCPPIQKYDIVNTFNQFGPDFGTTLFYKDNFIEDKAVYDAVRFYSDVNSAARRSTLLNDVPYRDVAYAEDQLFGEDLLEAGLLKAYAPRGSVIHSNDVSLRDYNKRIFDEVFALRKTGALIGKPTFANLTRGVIRDSIRIALDRQYGIKRKFYWLVINPLYHIQRYRGTKQALGTNLNEKSLDKKSLEHFSKSKH